LDSRRATVDRSDVSLRTDAKYLPVARTPQ